MSVYRECVWQKLGAIWALSYQKAQEIGFFSWIFLVILIYPICIYNSYLFLGGLIAMALTDPPPIRLRHLCGLVSPYLNLLYSALLLLFKLIRYQRNKRIYRTKNPRPRICLRCLGCPDLPLLFLVHTPPSTTPEHPRAHPGRPHRMWG